MTDERQIRPMPTTPGGVVDPDDLIGRENEVRQLLALSMGGGAKVLGDRRMGKTSLLRFVERELRKVGHTVIRVSAETNNPETFGRHLNRAMREEKLIKDAMREWTRQLGGEVTVNVGVAAIKLTCLPKQNAADPTVSSRELDLFQSCAEAARRAGPHRVIFIFDEITALARGLAASDPAKADEFFRTLRVPRQEIDNVSMFMAGSIGLHHVLRDMEVVNDITAVDVGALAHDDASYLTRCLLRGAAVAPDNEALVAESIVEACASIPFYIQKLVAKLDATGVREIEPPDVDALIKSILEDPADEWEMRHYADRLPSYYGHEAALVGHIIDRFALADEGLTVDQLAAELAAVPLDSRPDRDALLRLLPRLEADHYLRRDGGIDDMATPLLRRAWRSIRRLG